MIKLPLDKARQALNKRLAEIAKDSEYLGSKLLGEVQLCAAVVDLERVVGFRLAPAKLIRRGGYCSVEAARDDMLKRLRKAWGEHHKEARDG